ncbi:uncharacterized protein EAF02_005258 [Botrytis sinoallii]|uniref:uncharacterized protein n=1 Tax=Botrytis sinoallii TaxID=1463999 RepID=UPI001900D584|nr:uncharacterized protein EAF02_005258 [Botrytis sinoallii]KAF7883338.1 hypothetical protein EAF02_005258 [Botrytis sinoallii]
MAKNSIDGVVLITGAGGGIDQQAVYSFAEAGARAIALADINEENAQTASETARKYATHPDFRTLIIGVDVADAESVQKMIDVTAKEFERIDYAVNGAGCGNEETHMLMLCVRAELNAMLAQETRKMPRRSGERDIGRGVILNVGSANSYAGLPAKMAYTVSNHAVMGLTKVAALDHAADGIRVNAVCPTWVRTPMVEEECRRNPTVMQMVGVIVPLKRMAEPEEIADVIVFLCSPSASYVTATGIIIDAEVTLTVHMH